MVGDDELIRISCRLDFFACGPGVGREIHLVTRKAKGQRNRFGDSNFIINNQDVKAFNWHATKFGIKLLSHKCAGEAIQQSTNMSKKRPAPPK